MSGLFSFDKYYFTLFQHTQLIDVTCLIPSLFFYFLIKINLSFQQYKFIINHKHKSEGTGTLSTCTYQVLQRTNGGREIYRIKALRPKGLQTFWASQPELETYASNLWLWFFFVWQFFSKTNIIPRLLVARDYLPYVIRRYYLRQSSSC